jgi:hypothetical protein
LGKRKAALKAMETALKGSTNVRKNRSATDHHETARLKDRTARN